MRGFDMITRDLRAGRCTAIEGDDLDWLFETHLKGFAGLRPGIVIALLYGNEDAPDTVELYSMDRHNAPFLRFTVDDGDGPQPLIFQGVFLTGGLSVPVGGDR
jgi:hypothetical protein